MATNHSPLHPTENTTDQISLSQEAHALSQGFKSLCHFNSHHDFDFYWHPDVPEESKLTIKSLISTAFELDDDESDKFDDFETAKDYFYWKFYYIQQTDENLFDFSLPGCCPKTKTEPFHHNDMFYVTFDDVCLLFDNNNLSMGMIDFINECFNYFVCLNINKEDVPQFIFGDSSDLERIVPSKDVYPKIHEYFHKGKTRNTLTEDELIVFMKDWYTVDDKNLLTMILDKVKAIGKIISNYSVIFHLNNGWYISLFARFDSNMRASSLQIMDESQQNIIACWNVAAWLSKYFGLYVKESLSIPFVDDDFNGKDVYEALFKPLNLIDFDEEDAILDLEYMENADPLTDINSSGIFCLVNHISYITGKSFEEIVGTV